MVGGLLALALFGVSAAGPLEDGNAAHQRGDYATAVRLLRPLADKGNAVAQISLGDMSDKGEGVPQDYSKAATWYGKAANKGNADAQVRLGMMYYSGRNVPSLSQNFAKAAAWFRKAAYKGNAQAQMILGSMYEDGQGVPRDFVQAHMLFNLVASRQSSTKESNPFCEYPTLGVVCSAASSRDAVAAEMTPAQIAEAQRLASEWVPK